MVDSRPSVTIVVVTHNSAGLVPGLFESLPLAVVDAPEHTVVVVDNASTDESLDRVPAFARKVALGENQGYAAAINRGLAEVEPLDAALILNPDIRLEPRAVRLLFEALQLPRTGIAVPRLVSDDGLLAPSLRREPTAIRALVAALIGGTRAGRIGRLGELICDPRQYESPGTADWASGAVMMISRSCMDRVGRWDESLFLYAEETDFALRARDAGFLLRYVPDAGAVHIGGDSHQDPDLWSLLMVNRLRLFARRNSGARTLAFHSALVLNEGLRSLGGSPVHLAALSSLIRVSGRRLRRSSLDSRQLDPRWRAASSSGEAA